MKDLSIASLASSIISGDRAALGRGITIVESHNPKHQVQAIELLEILMPHAGGSIRIGISGVPGVGKSTFIEALGNYCVKKGSKVAVLAVDPSSQRTGGSILGDKTRMESLAREEAVFIRPSPAGTQLGGVAQHTQQAITLCEAAGYDTILVETVGVGQSEIAVSDITDIFLLLMLTGAGDDLQGIKRGIIELCDIMIINKVDGDNVAKAKVMRTEFARALHLFPAKYDNWKVPIHLVSSIEQQGIDKVYQSVHSFIALQKETNNFYTRRNEQQLKAFEAMLHDQIIQQFYAQAENKKLITDLRQQIISGKMSNATALNAVSKEK